jgi:hypothetical protein
MPLQLKHPILKDYHLEESDRAFLVEDEPTRITIRQATQRDHERRAQLFSSIIREMGDDDDIIRMIQKFSFEELKRVEVMLTLAGSTIKGIDGKPLFEFDSNGRIKSEHQFMEAWGQLPPIVASEIHDCVIELNVDWRAPSGE